MHRRKVENALAVRRCPAISVSLITGGGESVLRIESSTEYQITLARVDVLVANRIVLPILVVGIR